MMDMKIQHQFKELQFWWNRNRVSTYEVIDKKFDGFDSTPDDKISINEILKLI